MRWESIRQLGGAHRARLAAEAEKAFGDCQAMCKLGMWYRGGEEGFPKNKELAYKWYKRAADKRDVKGMGAAGYRLVQGIGVAKNISEGVHLTTLAAELGSNFEA